MTKVVKMPDMWVEGSDGKLRIRQSKVEEQKDGSAIWTVVFGIEGGKLNTKTQKFTEGKQGRNAFEQACFTQASRHDKKKKKDKYTEDKTSAKKRSEGKYPNAMLARKIQDKPPIYPCYMQPKMDGNRCLAKVWKNGKVEMWSREGNFWQGFDHITDKLAEIFKDEGPIIIDGELFTWEFPFKDLNGALKLQEDPEGKKQKVSLWIYDVIRKGETWETRWDWLKRKCKDGKIPLGTLSSKAAKAPLILTPTRKVKDLEEAKAVHRDNLQTGYEGSIIRNAHGIYEAAKRSPNLIKWKEKQDEEFLVVGAVENQGLPGTCKFILQTSDGVKFDAMPKGSMQERAEMWQNHEEYLGKMMTVEFFEKFDDGTPRFPIAVRLEAH